MGSPWPDDYRTGLDGFAAEEDDKDTKKKEAEQSLPSVGNNDAVLCADVDALKKKTTPPSKFSEDSLIEAIASIHRFVSKAKAVLKENEDIGTEATRASILEILKSRGFIATNGKSLVSTPLGLSLIPVPTCGKALRQREGKNTGEFFWVCSNTDCRTFLPNKDGTHHGRRQREHGL